MEYLRVWEYHCDLLERALCSLHNARIDCQDALISGRVSAKNEERLINTLIAVKSSKEKYNLSFEKLKTSIEKTLSKPSLNQPVRGLWEIFLSSLVDSHNLIEECCTNLTEEENLNQNVVTSLLVFIRERPLLDKKALDTIEVYK